MLSYTSYSYAGALLSGSLSLVEVLGPFLSMSITHFYLVQQMKPRRDNLKAFTTPIYLLENMSDLELYLFNTGAQEFTDEIDRQECVNRCLAVHLLETTQEDLAEEMEKYLES